MRWEPHHSYATPEQVWDATRKLRPGTVAYQEHANDPLEDVPYWIAEAAYDELDRRPFEWAQ